MKYDYGNATMRLCRVTAIAHITFGYMEMLGQRICYPYSAPFKRDNLVMTQTCFYFQFHLDSLKVGFVFLILSAVYTILAPVLGMLAEKTVSIHFFLILLAKGYDETKGSMNASCKTYYADYRTTCITNWLRYGRIGNGSCLLKTL